MNKTISGWVLLAIAVVCYVIAYFLDGVVGQGIGVIGLICLALSIVRGITSLVNKRKQKLKV